MSASELYKEIEKVIEKENQAGDEEALALMTAAVVMETGDVSAISAYTTGFCLRLREVLSLNMKIVDP